MMYLRYSVLIENEVVEFLVKSGVDPNHDDL